jgi:hypothetical protein
MALGYRLTIVLHYDADPETIPGASWRDPEQVETWSQEIPKDRRVTV